MVRAFVVVQSQTNCHSHIFDAPFFFHDADKKKLPALQPLKSISHNQPDNGCSKSNRSKSARDLESNKPSRPSHSRSNSVGDGARRRNKATFHANNASLFDMSGLSDLEKDEGNVHRNWLTDLASQVTTKALEGASRSMLDFQGNQHRRRVNLHKSLLEASMHGHDEDDDDDETEAVDFETNILNLDDDEEPNNPEFPRADSPKHGPFKQSVSPIGTSYISSPSSNEGELPSPSKGAATLLKSPPCADQQPTTNVDCVTKEDTTNTSAKDSTVSESLYCAFETTLDLGADKDLQSVGLTLVPNGLLKSPSIFDLGQHHTQYDDATAVGIAQVEPGSDAEKAGLCPFDFIYTQSAVSDCAQAHKLLVLRLKSTVSDTKMPASTTTTTVQSEITGEAPAESNVLEYDSMGKDDGSKGKTDAWKDHDPLSSNWLDGSGDASLTMHNGSGSDLLEGLEQLWEQGLHSPESNEATVEVVPPPASRTGKTLQTLETLSNQMEPTNEPSEETIAVSMTGTKLSDNESNRGSEDNSFNEAKPPPKPSKTVKKSKARPSAGSVPPTLRRSRRQLDLDAEVEAVSNPDEIGRRGRGGHRI